MRTLALCFCFAIFASADVQGQKLTLQRVDTMVAAGDGAAARTALAQWRRENASLVNDPYHLFLSAQVEADAQKARDIYVSIALSHPTSRFAAPALLRLGQSLVAAGDERRAMSYLDRLLTDYPAAAERPAALLWLARAQAADGLNTEACATAGRGLKAEVRDSELLEQLRNEELKACNAPARGSSDSSRRAQPQPQTQTAPPTPTQAVPPRTQPPTPPPTRPSAPVTQTTPAPRDTVAKTTATQRASTTVPAPEQPTNTSRATNDAARFAVQSGAFRDPRGASSVAKALNNAGFEARVVMLESSALAHVRVGRFTTRADAVAQAERIKQAGFNAFIVDDLRREKNQ